MLIYFRKYIKYISTSEVDEQIWSAAEVIET